MKRLALALFLLLLAANAHAAVLRVVIDDMIHPISDEFLGRALDRAKETNADAVIVELRTPGGLETSMRAMVEKIMKSPVPVIVWVGPSGSRAASAGFFILEAADLAAMAPGTNTGAAHPILISGEKMDDVLKMKIQNDAAAFIRTIAQRRGRNVQAAESGVREAKSFTEDEALSGHLIEVIAADVPSLLRWADGKTVKRFSGAPAVLHVRGKPLVDYEMTLKQRVLSWIMDPNIAFILLAVGVISLWFEFNHPGAIAPGVIGGIGILLAVFALNILPTRFAALGLILAAFILFALEAKFVSHGVLGAGGVVCLIFGATLLVDGPIPEMRVHPSTAIAVSIPIGVIAVFLMTLVMRARNQRVATGVEAMIGKVGVARTQVGPDGKVFVHGELWNASARTEIAEGSRVRVRGVEGLRVLVEPAES
ncbi:MAG TPA: nodulation protein NfeD [Thermoanaerobaculia bacterium]|nr:nodulation protein NfeD [Thermoanaerobaculia bacterium]